MLRPSIVKISTPRGSGTGFIIAHSKANNICGIATAAHVVNNAFYWEEPIRIDHLASGQSVVVHHTERAIRLEERFDTAAILISRSGVFLQEYTLPVTPEGMFLKVGSEVGWLGFPALSPNNLCFFTGRASCYIEGEGAYLIDGVAINGVSGGPAFQLSEHFPVTIGVVSAYMPNRATGETLPGLGVVRDVRQFQALIKHFKSLDDAKQQETPPVATPSIPPPDEPPPAMSPNEAKIN